MGLYFEPGAHWPKASIHLVSFVHGICMSDACLSLGAFMWMKPTWPVKYKSFFKTISILHIQSSEIHMYYICFFIFSQHTPNFYWLILASTRLISIDWFCLWFVCMYVCACVCVSVCLCMLSRPFMWVEPVWL